MAQENVLVHYPRIWRPLKERGVEDHLLLHGNITSLLDDLAEAGADGFVIERYVSLESNVDEGVLTFGTPEDV